MAITAKTRKKLWAKSGNRCSFPECNIELCVEDGNEDDVTLGEECHIVAKNDDGSRGKSKLNRKQRDMYDNLILMCPTHHTMIDNDEITYTIDVLNKMKAEHEEWVKGNLSKKKRKENEFYFEDETLIGFDNEVMSKIGDWIVTNTEYDCISSDTLKESISKLSLLGKKSRKMLVRVINYFDKEECIDIPTIHQKLIGDDVCDENEFFTSISTLMKHGFIEFDTRFEFYEDENGDAIILNEGSYLFFMNKECFLGNNGLNFYGIKKYLNNKKNFKELVVDKEYELL